MTFLSKKNYFLFLLMTAFVFISTTAMALNKDSDAQDLKPLANFQAVKSVKHFPQNPILGANTTFPLISAQGVIAVDLDSGVPLYEKNPDSQLLPASTTKIVTALVAIETYKPDEILTVPYGVAVDGQKMGLYSGEQMRFKDLLYGLLVYSANDAAMTLAMNYPMASESGTASYEAFVLAMNEKAQELHMDNSYFENPVGLDGASQMTTARDLLHVSEVAMKNPEFAEVVGTKEITVTDVSGSSKYRLKNINELLEDTPGVLGIKTGWTENARENLVTYIERDGHKVIIAVLGSQDRFGETQELIDWIFSNYEWQEVKK